MDENQQTGSDYANSMMTESFYKLLCQDMRNIREAEKSLQKNYRTFSSLVMCRLNEPMDDELSNYYNGLSGVKFAAIAKKSCKVVCVHCGDPLIAKWRGRSQVDRSRTDDGRFVNAEPCDHCCRVARTRMLKEAYAKWSPILEKDRECFGHFTIHDFELQYFAETLFDGNVSFIEKSWTCTEVDWESFSAFLSRTHPLLTLTLDGSLVMSFQRLNVFKATDYWGSQQFVDWAMRWIEMRGKRACDWKFQMTGKFGSGLRSLLAKVNFDQCSYALWSADREVSQISPWMAVEKEEVFKSRFLSTLSNLFTGKWPVSDRAKVFARVQCPESFHELVRVKEHSLSEDDIYCEPLGQLWEKIEKVSTGANDNSTVCSQILVEGVCNHPIPKRAAVLRKESVKTWMGINPKNCDVCKQPLQGEFVDGKTNLGRWGKLCLQCHENVGVGKGQKYRFDIHLN